MGRCSVHRHPLTISSRRPQGGRTRFALAVLISIRASMRQTPACSFPIRNSRYISTTRYVVRNSVAYQNAIKAGKATRGRSARIRGTFVVQEDQAPVSGSGLRRPCTTGRQSSDLEPGGINREAICPDPAGRRRHRPTCPCRTRATGGRMGSNRHADIEVPGETPHRPSRLNACE